MTRKFTLGKGERLKSNLSIQELLTQGKVVSGFPFKIYWQFTREPYQQFPARAAISVPKRKFKRAVDRNLMKRRLREAYRLNKHILYDTLQERGCKIHLVILFLSDEFIPYNRLEDEMSRMLQILTIKISKTPL
jgi:ribonuclease P protein component